MLKLYDYLEVMVEEQNRRQQVFETGLDFFASDIMGMLKIDDSTEISSSLKRTFEACSTLNFPFERNFKKVYRFDGENLFMDWKISSLACYLIIINCEPSHEYVAKAQLYFAMNQIASEPTI